MTETKGSGVFDWNVLQHSSYKSSGAWDWQSNRRRREDHDKTHPNWFEMAIGGVDRVVQRVGG